ncbi:sigma-70 family RNA polymerase sigma factor [Fusobacterium necrophorum]|mgnify:FL=1|uniref:RNA polymerase sigma factor SigS n=2 Tax=Fusobacterium necrophorum TaxID=859 RepID=A0AB73BV81_9FUSO|nr:sigma-70 family RNA polymerase sigma factor [Fusobacterium necrophorum]AYZ73480.1 sigma-70 family RNA polymerase sigma factor [Fusobacterium necrophorum]AZW08523.1 sigma-70 family RNA polymerase sigma factor [Fusobacterium necrophorum subsp. necrophorum]KDE61791.1 RNA polymerase sigma70 factor [Fusobacterium necrophorum BFTR-1]KDE62341.1 RNA polymerase sigma70 factor [Fusobacterium necrophorum BL]KDE66950.1 RNA polymerase sigma70 factor [Fusobacterium necrophorum DJ-1]
MNLEQENIPEELIEKAKNGDQEAITFIIECYQNVISMSASHYYMVGAEKQDLLQEGMLGLLKALKAYDKEKSSFRTFAILCIRRQLISAIKASNTKKNLVFHHAVIKNPLLGEEELLGKSSYDPEELYLSKEKIQEYYQYIQESFSAFEKEIFHYMIQGYSYREIGMILSKNSKSIDNAFQRIKKKSEVWLQKYNLE